MKKLVLAAIAAGAIVAGTAGAAGTPPLAPHVYAVKVTGSPNPLLNATWRLGLQPRTFAVTRNGAYVVKGTLSIAGSKATFHDVSGALACKGAEATGTYGWVLRGSRLILKPINDTCAGRRAVLPLPFKRVS